MSFRLLLGSASVLALGASSLLWTTESTAFAANTESEESIEKHQILIIGGGTGGITAAAQIRRRMKNADVAIVDPSDVHYYQPLWTMVGGGLFSVKDSVKPMSAVVPSGCAWLKDSVITFDPESNTVQLASGRRLKYEYLVVAAGLQINYGAVKGLEETIGKNQVCSIYTRDQAEYVWETAQRVQEGLAIFTVPKTPIKCGGAPQKIMYLLEDHWRDQGLRAGDDPKVRVAFAPSAATMFGVQHFGDKLNVIRQEKNIEAFFSHELVEVRGERKEAVFRTPEGEKIVEFSMLHVTPPMSAPDFLKTSPLVDANGYVEVDKHTLRHTRYPNVFSLGDCTNLPTSKTAAAIAGQAPVLVQNLQRVVDGQEPVAKYDGYSSCPIITGKNSLMLAEFLYDGVPVSSFPGDNRVPRLAFFLLKKYGFPFAYWNLMLKGYWYGRHHLFERRFF